MKYSFPNNKKFAFTVLDDTDNANLSNIKLVYDLLDECGLKTSKTTWIYPPRDNYFSTQTINDPEYLEYLLELKKKGFEVLLHSVGSGIYFRDEILAGYEKFKKTFGYYPNVHTNHARNPDNIYWSFSSRFVFPFNILYYALSFLFLERPQYQGEKIESKYFWGDFAKQHIKYFRGFTFNDINTIKQDKLIPYKIKRWLKFSNYWFSSSDGHSLNEFNRLLSFENINRLEKENGVCIVYTHFAEGFVIDGKINPEFEEKIRFISQKDGYFVPVTELLDFLLLNRDDKVLNDFYLLKLNVNWFIQRIVKYLRFKK